MNEWASLIAAGAGSGVLGAIVTGLLNRKKLGADASAAISDAAATTVKGVTDDYRRVLGENGELRQRIEALERDKQARDVRDRERDERDRVRDRRQARLDQESRDALQLHAAYDHVVSDHLRQAQTDGYLVGIIVPSVPPLYPPAAQRHEVQQVDSEQDMDSND